MSNQSELNLPDLGKLRSAGPNAGAAAKPVVENQPETIDLTGRALDDTSIEQRFRDAGVYGEHGGPLGTSPTAGSGKRVDLSALYGPFGGPLD